MKTQAVERYLLDELAPEERDSFEEHFFTCAECADAVRIGTIFTVNGREAAQERGGRPSPARAVTEINAPIPGRPARGVRPRWTASLSAAAAAMLAVVVGYQNLVAIPHMKSAGNQPRALTPAVLHGQSRGSLAVVKLTGNSAAALTIELNADRLLPAYRVSVRSGGKSLAEIPDVPVKNGALEIYVPPDFPAGSYDIQVRGPSDGADAGHFPFEIEK